MSGLHLLVLAPLAREDKNKLEKVFDSVSYGDSEQLSWNAGPPIQVNEDVLQKTTVIFGWQVPKGVTMKKQMPNLKWQMTPSAGADVRHNYPHLEDRATRRLTATLHHIGLCNRKYCSPLSGKTKLPKRPFP